MTPHDLATKIAEEVFKTIESERAIIKAQIVEAVEKVLRSHGPQASQQTWFCLLPPSCEFAELR